MQWIKSVETYDTGRVKNNLVCKKGKIKRNNLIKQYKNVYLWLYNKRRHKGT